MLKMAELKSWSKLSGIDDSPQQNQKKNASSSLTFPRGRGLLLVLQPSQVLVDIKLTNV